MTIKNSLNQKELICALSEEGVDVKTAKAEIRETIENKFLWFRVGEIIVTYTPSRRKKWCMMFR